MNIREPKKWIGERIGDVMATTFLSAPIPVMAAEQRAATSIDITRVTFALAAFRADHKQYPDALAKLVPDYIAAIPRDAFGAALRYESDGAEYTLIGAGQPNFDIIVNTPGRIADE